MSQKRDPSLPALIEFFVTGPCTRQPRSGVEMRRSILIHALVQVGRVVIRPTFNASKAQIEELSALGVEAVTLVHAASPSPDETPSNAADIQVFESIKDLQAYGNFDECEVVLDLDDVKSDLIRQRLGILSRSTRDVWSMQSGSPDSLSERQLRPRLRALSNHVGKIGRMSWSWWRQRGAERKAIRRCARVLVCSEDDRLRLGAKDQLVVVPNAYQLRSVPVGRADVSFPPVVAVWGLMSYWPNADAAEWATLEVFPHLRRAVPGVRLLIIGQGGEQLAIPRADDIEVRGFVDDLEAVLSSVDVALVPLRSGGGTRIKILEAWGHRIPVVATTIGAYGLAATNGQELLIADHPQEIASALERCLSDHDLRKRLVENGERHARRFHPDDVTKRLALVISELT